jgi:hypothetical protein
MGDIKRQLLSKQLTVLEEQWLILKDKLHQVLSIFSEGARCAYKQVVNNARLFYKIR